MLNHQTISNNEPLEKASAFLRDGIPRGSIYKMAKLGLIPSYRVGPKQSGVRFKRSEVLSALRRPLGEVR
jgi:hypothetical protein